MRVADALATVLRELDLKYVFGVSGANIEHVHDAIHRLGAGRLSSVLARREDGAANMADARARTHRTLGVCCATSGGGMMNLVAGLAESYAQSVPVLALVGQPPAGLDGRGSFQDSSGIGRTVAAGPLLASMTKRVERIVDPDSFWIQLRAVIEAAVNDRMGPVALLLPRDCHDFDVGDVPEDFPLSLAGFMRPAPVEPEPVRDLFARLRTARRPVLLVGSGVRRSTNPEAVVKFASRAQIPVMTTMGARGEFPHDDPCYYGTVGANGHPSAAAYLSDEADLVVLVGTGPSMMTRACVRSWNPKRTIAVNIDPADAVSTGVAGTIVAGDSGKVFEQLNELLDAEPFTRQLTDRYQLTRFRPHLAEPLPGTSSRTPDLSASVAVSIIERYLPRHGHLFYDAGNCAVVTMHHTSVPAGCTSTSAFGMGGMGYTFGGAVGAQLGAPDGTRTVTFCGDGAFLMSGQEVHTAVQLRLPILYVVFNNGMHGMCATRQQKFFDSRIEAVSYPPVDVTAVSRGYGTPDRLWVGKAGTVAELLEALADHQRHAQLTGVLELVLPVEEMPPFAAFMPADAPTTQLKQGKRDDNH
nr:thiamine pyrophosphate-binding protein [Kibdelosporangium sp. MJ126-NF4]CEL13400.1 Acetolactate synthase large subunit [Kibdelosporangium sp. MJ126-NF4]CTQ99089.1 Acetolactate synthase large subunit (EC 2.2.1.6) [Kibdelosporangium sp. MJ126-NF4]